MIFQACGMNEAVVSEAAINPILSVQFMLSKVHQLPSYDDFAVGHFCIAFFVEGGLD